MQQAHRFGDPARSGLDFIERYSSRMLVHFCVVLLLFANQFMAAIVIIQDFQAVASLLWLPTDISKFELLLSALELQEEELLRATRVRRLSTAIWHNYSNSF